MTAAHSERYQALDSQITELEFQICALLLQVVQLKSERNDLAPISRLPNEVLCKIAMEYKASTPLVLDVPQKQYKRLGWPVMTHVCRRWRHACLHHQELWAEIDSSEPMSWIQEKLERSKAAPLSVRWASTTRIFPRAGLRMYRTVSDAKVKEDLLRRVVDRVKQVELQGPERFLDWMLEDILSQTPPLLLHHLSFHNDAPPASTPDWEADPAHMYEAVIPSAAEVKLSETPQLRQLVFKDCTPRLESFKTTHLTSLSLQLRGGVQPLPAGEFMDMLRNARSLVTLQLSRALPDYDATSFSSSMIHLPYLKHIRMGDRYRRCITLLQHLRLPPSASVELNFDKTAPNGIGADLGGILSSMWSLQGVDGSRSAPLSIASMTLQQHLRGGYGDDTTSHFIGLSVQRLGMQQLSGLDGKTYVLHSESSPLLPGPNLFALSIAFQTPKADNADAVTKLLRQDLFDFSVMRSLHLDIAYRHEDLASSLVSSQSLEELYVSHTTSKWFIDWLRSDPMLSSSHSNSAGLFLPKLKALHFESALHLYPRKAYEQFMSMRDPKITCLDDLAWVMNKRMEMMCCLDEVVFCRSRWATSSFTDEELEVLNGLAPSVYVREDPNLQRNVVICRLMI
ncbi:hypothetical protein CC1G_01015 [Coprinopsis cinerea okayama7|uniref:Uncharacterized protein n=1 Tax=Coprinopsis cinerea (strain Okayama-7 / 130 / ATCC MYA-4618 / FGSC 9003) TaxID=240176 RepID=A8NE77_COPC7|nr:hypothetical protein CC1G_01015 [Coprinopsis cinerea okayama7\|eukprot:XP_001832953.1 hypothetical protein CC1G_01015 [Coprinopsis cinerea okayama7\